MFPAMLRPNKFAFLGILGLLLIASAFFVQASRAGQPAQVEPVTITITDQGFEPEQITIVEGMEVTWRNETDRDIILQSGPFTTIYFPFIHQNTTAAAQARQRADTADSPRTPTAEGDFFSVTIAANSSFTHLYTVLGNYPIAVLNPPFWKGIIFVLRGGDIHGSIFTDLKNQEIASGTGLVYLPDISVYAQRVSDGAKTPAVLTDLHGRFIIENPRLGDYQICWEGTGWFPGCTNTIYTVGSEVVYPLPIQISPERFVVGGRVRQEDGAACRVVDPLFGTSVHTTVSLLDAVTGLPAVPAVRANVLGEYVFGRVPQGSYVVSAECENARVDKNVVVASGPAVKVDLTLPNSSPQVSTVVAFDGGQGVRLVPAGSTVQVSVDVGDANGDPLHYAWFADAPGFTSVDAPTINWTLPSAPAEHKIYVQVRDENGGYDVRSATVSTGPGILFSGVVRGNDGPVIGGAAVTINGKSATTDVTGYFDLMLPAESPRYVVTIEKIGYALFSKIYYEGLTNGDFLLHRAFHVVIDPAQGVEVAERDPTGKPATVLLIDPDSLVDSSGNPASGPLDLFMKTVNLEDPNNSFPGDDYAGRSSSGEEVGIVSYGAVDIQFVDASGERYNLAPGKKARVSIPVDPGQLAAGAPSSIPLWFYDPINGVWVEEGKATLTGNFYTAEVEHFSSLNMDVEFNDAACMRINIDQNVLTLPVNLQVTVPTGTGQDKMKTTTLNDQLSVITRLQPNQPVTLEVLDSAGNPIALATQTISSGAGIGSAPIDLEYPYLECNSDATLTIGLPEDPPFDPPAGEYHFLTRKGIDDAASTAAYYAAIDPTNSKTIFSAWKLANGMADNPDANLNGNYFDDDAVTGEISAVYANAGDLGFGREMHAKKVGNDIAFYVCNYDTVDEARIHANRGACVAMEYSPLPGGSTPFIKFYVFNAADNRVASANLDGRGEKFVPGLCMACHQGNYNPAEVVAASGGLPDRVRFQVSPPGNPNQGSQFLPFDLDAFGYSTVVGFRRSDQEAKFKALNNLILDANPDTGVVEVINGWYAGGSATQISSFVPPNWVTTTAQANLYSQVVKPSCRTCHVAQNGILNWTDFSDFDTFSGSIQYAICTSREMPHAKVTFERFWLSQSPNQPAALGAAGLSGWPSGTDCPTP